ncbi:MAG: endonuclease [Ferruginibacter sp.]|nr:endonuclease [Ferruginibacter sp.]
MPEGPSIVILKDAVKMFTGQKIIAVTGNSKIDQQRLLNNKIIAFKSWGKHFLICFKDFTVRIHFLLFGSYLVNEKKDRPVRLGLTFKTGEINFYACAIRIIEEDINAVYDWSADVMNDEWDEKKAITKLKKLPGLMVCDALLTQEIFAGVGNIIKNEVLYRICVHPESKTGKLPAAKMNALVKQARVYSFEFLEWKKNYELKKHWLAHTKKTCHRCELPLIKKITGVKKRRSFYCEHCQLLYDK